MVLEKRPLLAELSAIRQDAAGNLVLTAQSYDGQCRLLDRKVLVTLDPETLAEALPYRAARRLHARLAELLKEIR